MDHNTGTKYIDYEHTPKKKLLSEPDPLEVILSDGVQHFTKTYLKIWTLYQNDNKLSPMNSATNLFTTLYNSERRLGSQHINANRLAK